MPGPHGGTLKIKSYCIHCDAMTEMHCRLCMRPMCAEHAVEGGDICVECASDRSGYD